MKNFATPPNFRDIEVPKERQKLRFLEKVPQYPNGVRAPKMTKRIDLIRGEEEIHNQLIHKQYGIIALRGGMLRWGHLEMVRLGIGRKMDTNRMFAIWRIDPPWKPRTKKGQGKRMGGGKGSIDHYVTPVKAGRVIVELGGKCTFEEVYPLLEVVAHKLPFPALVVSQELLKQRKAHEELLEQENQNRYTFKYLIQNNLMGCHRWARKIDHEYYGKYY
ncbi:mitochondrial ribosomal protein L16 isoform X4 [Oratosquilla oratoria]